MLVELLQSFTNFTGTFSPILHTTYDVLTAIIPLYR